MNIYKIDLAMRNDLILALESEDPDHQLKVLGIEHDRHLLDVACYSAELEREAEALKKTEDELKKRRQSLEKKSKHADDFLMEFLKGRNIRDERISITFRNKPPHIVIDKEEDIPKEFMKVVETPMKKELQATIKEHGEIVPGCHLSTPNETGFSMSRK